MNSRRKRVSTLVASLMTLGVIAAACTPPAPTAVPQYNYKIFADTVTINNSQDETCVLGVCANSNDEAYVLQIAFKVTIGQANSAATWVTGHRDNATPSIGAGTTYNLTGAQEAPAFINALNGVDILDLATNNSKLEIGGTYFWAAESDTVGIAGAASDVADILKDALNDTLAAASGNIDTNTILDLVFDNLGNAFTLLLANIPLLGLGDDTLGGGFYVVIGARGSLASLLDTAIGGYTAPGFDVPVLDLPPDIQNIGIAVTNGTTTFPSETFTGAGGQHTYNIKVAPN